MILDGLSLLAVVVLVITTLLLLLSQNWRWSIIALAVQYLAIFILVMQVWPLGLAAVKLIAGWMAGAVFSYSQPNPSMVEETSGARTGFIFRFLVAILIWLLVFTLSPRMVSILPLLPPSLVTGAMLLIGMGLIQLGMTTRPLRVMIGLLTTLAGFELLYAAVEKSVLVAGLLAMVTLGLALVGAYLLDSLSASEAGAAADQPGSAASTSEDLLPGTSTPGEDTL